jgi:hypothetical protein
VYVLGSERQIPPERCRQQFRKRIGRRVPTLCINGQAGDSHRRGFKTTPHDGSDGERDRYQTGCDQNLQ